MVRGHGPRVCQQPVGGWRHTPTKDHHHHHHTTPHQPWTATKSRGAHHSLHHAPTENPPPGGGGGGTCGYNAHTTDLACLSRTGTGPVAGTGHTSSGSRSNARPAGRRRTPHKGRPAPASWPAGMAGCALPPPPLLPHSQLQRQRWSVSQAKGRARGGGWLGRQLGTSRCAGTPPWGVTFTHPSFLPQAVSSSMPTHVPDPKLVVPRNLHQAPNDTQPLPIGGKGPPGGDDSRLARADKASKKQNKTKTPPTNHPTPRSHKGCAEATTAPQANTQQVIVPMWCANAQKGQRPPTLYPRGGCVGAAAVHLLDHPAVPLVSAGDVNPVANLHDDRLKAGRCQQYIQSQTMHVMRACTSKALQPPHPRAPPTHQPSK
jgi:hypothetical protein